MKKRKYKKNKRNNKKIKKSKHNIILICIIVYIIIVVILAIFYIMRFKSRNITKNELNNNDIITYMGEKISKKKLITEFLSRVSADDNIVGHEKQRFSSLFYLPEYSDNHNLRNNIKNSFMNIFRISSIIKTGMSLILFGNKSSKDTKSKHMTYITF